MCVINGPLKMSLKYTRLTMPQGLFIAASKQSLAKNNYFYCHHTWGGLSKTVTGFLEGKPGGHLNGNFF